MFNDIWNRFRRHAPVLLQRDEAAWRRDPLSHPVLQRMTATELADLPLNWSRTIADTPETPNAANDRGEKTPDRLCA